MEWAITVQKLKGHKLEAILLCASYREVYQLHV